MKPNTGYYVVLAIILAVLGGLNAFAQVPTSIGPNQPVAWSQGPSSPDESGDRPPNIVLILADDLGWNDLTFNGGGIAGGTVPTPNIDSIAKEGVLFRNGYSACGTCAPSRAAIMSGRYPTRFGFEFTPTPGQMLPMIARMAGVANPPLITYFDEYEQVPFNEMGMPTEEVTLAEVLKQKGYYTAHIGKWHLGGEFGMSAINQGFDDSLLMAGGKYLPDDDPNVVNSKQDFDPIDRFLWMSTRHAASFNDGPLFSPGGYLTDEYTDEAIKVIEANRNRPFFLYLAHWAVHTPLQATREDYDAVAHIENHTERVYAAMIRSLDRSVGRVLQALKENGLDENTLVIFTSDNGGAGYLGLPGVNEPYRGWKITFFEGGIHVPYFMRWPGTIEAGTVYDHPVHHFDIFATAAAAAGAPMPADRPTDGVNLLPYIGAAGEAVSSDAKPHDRLFWRGGHYQVVLSDGWKLQRAARPEKVWLFNLSEDPTEQHNVADAYPDRVERMLKMLDEHNREQVEPLWPALVESPIRIDKTVPDPRSPDDEYVYWPN